MVKILIVEDDPLMLRMYQKIFSFEGYEVVTAIDGEEGLQKARQENPTLILLDIMMPKMNGLQVLEELKSDPSTSKIPMVMLTNLAGTQDAETALSKGAVKYIIKSEYEPRQVADMVKEVLAGYTRNEIPTPSALSKSNPTQSVAGQASAVADQGRSGTGSFTDDQASSSQSNQDAAVVPQDPGIVHDSDPDH